MDDWSCFFFLFAHLTFRLVFSLLFLHKYLFISMALNGCVDLNNANDYMCHISNIIQKSRNNKIRLWRPIFVNPGYKLKLYVILLRRFTASIFLFWYKCWTLQVAFISVYLKQLRGKGVLPRKFNYVGMI